MPKAQPKASMSFIQSRKAILDTMTAKAQGDVKKKVIKFRNDDVPRFLETLYAYETRSRQTKIAVG